MRDENCEISIKLQSNLIKITLQYRCSPVNFARIFRTLFPKNNSGGLILWISYVRNFGLFF